MNNSMQGHILNFLQVQKVLIQNYAGLLSGMGGMLGLSLVSVIL